MNSKLLKEYEEFEGLSGVPVDEDLLEEKEDADDPSNRPTAASTLSPDDFSFEMARLGLKESGFRDQDNVTLQRALDEDFRARQDEMRAKKREKLRRAAQQLGLQKRRMQMERSLQEEQDELAKDHQINMLIDLIKDNQVNGSLRVDVNSVTARCLAKALWVNDSVTCLDISNNQLNDHAGTYIARVLKHNQALKKLELDNNQLGPKSAAAFGEALATNESVVYLSLDSNEIVSDSDQSGILALADALKQNRTLTSLNLWRTGLTIESGSILASAIEQNHTLLFCDIGANYLDIGDVRRIVDKLDENLAQYEQSERERRKREASQQEIRQKEHEKIEQERKQVELQHWLRQRREERAEDRRQNEQQRIFKMQEELEERKRLADMRLTEEKKAKEAADEKKNKKKGDKKKK
jgi:hypothetical protein